MGDKNNNLDQKLKKRPKTKKIIFFLVVICLMPFLKAESAEIPNTQILKAETIEQLGVDYLLGQKLGLGENFEMAIDYKGGDITLPLGSLDFNIKLTRGNLNATRFPVLMTISVDGVFRRGLWMNAQIKTYGDVVKPRRPIQPGTILSAEDVILERGLLESTTHNFATRLEDVVGFKAIRGLNVGVPIRLIHLIRAPLIKRGDRVLIVAEKGQMRITTPGIAREKGFKGNMVAVENIESKKMVYGLVVNAALVQVKF